MWLSPLTLGLARSGGITNAPAPFTPATLFANSEAGAWYDPSDTSTLAQNSDGTTSVSVGDPVGYMADKSGNGRHATQSTGSHRTVLRKDTNGNYYLEADGTDDDMSMSMPDIDFGAIYAGVQAGEVVPRNRIFFAPFALEFWDNNGNGNPKLISYNRYDSGGFILATGGLVSTDVKYVCGADFDGTRILLDLNGSTNSKNISDTLNVYATGYLFSIGSNEYFQGRFYGLTLLGRATTATERENLRAYYAAKMGITL